MLAFWSQQLAKSGTRPVRVLSHWDRKSSAGRIKLLRHRSDEIGDQVPPNQQSSVDGEAAGFGRREHLQLALFSRLARQGIGDKFSSFLGAVQHVRSGVMHCRNRDPYKLRTWDDPCRSTRFALHRIRETNLF